MDSELALGVALAPTALGLALLRGHGADGVVLDRDLIETTTAIETAKGAILRTYSTAVKHGYRIRAVDITHTGVEAAAAVQLVNALRQVGVRNVVVVDPTSAASVAAGRALDMVRVPTESPRVAGGRHRGAPASSTPRRIAIGAAATGVLTVLATTVVVHATSTGPVPPAAPPPEPSAAPVASSTVSPPTPTTPRSVFTGESRESRSPASVSVTPITAASPSPEPAAPVVTESSATSAVPETPALPEPPAVPQDPTSPPAEGPAAPPLSDGSAHLPASEDGPRSPGPA